jgi:hypothetical protein
MLPRPRCSHTLENKLTLEGGQTNYVNVVLLPAQKASALNTEQAVQVYAHAYTKIAGTEARYRYDEASASIITDFTFTPQLMRSGPEFENTILTTLFRLT